jgi:hypothetical protein
MYPYYEIDACFCFQDFFCSFLWSTVIPEIGLINTIRNSANSVRVLLNGPPLLRGNVRCALYGAVPFYVIYPMWKAICFLYPVPSVSLDYLGSSHMISPALKTNIDDSNLKVLHLWPTFK